MYQEVTCAGVALTSSTVSAVAACSPLLNAS